MQEVLLRTRVLISKALEQSLVGLEDVDQVFAIKKNLGERHDTLFLEIKELGLLQHLAGRKLVLARLLLQKLEEDLEALGQGKILIFGLDQLGDGTRELGLLTGADS